MLCSPNGGQPDPIIFSAPLARKKRQPEEEIPMKPGQDESAWAKEIKKKVDEEMVKKEIETVLYWKGEMEKILAKRPESLATFQIEIQNFLQRMQNRARVLKGSLQK
jgi:hypothetical protein